MCQPPSSQPDPTPPHPQRVRIICLDPLGAVLLMKWRDPVDGHVFWEPPGGGIEPGETSRQAAVRELFEETGLTRPLEADSVLVERDYHWAGRHFRHVEEFFWVAAGASGSERADIGLQAPTAEEVATFLAWRFVAIDGFDDLDAPLQPPNLGRVVRARPVAPDA